jgi:hypothetical protein
MEGERVGIPGPPGKRFDPDEGLRIVHAALRQDTLLLIVRSGRVSPIGGRRSTYCREHDQTIRQVSAQTCHQSNGW